jgi:hypothetical protein
VTPMYGVVMELCEKRILTEDRVNSDLLFCFHSNRLIDHCVHAYQVWCVDRLLIRLETLCYSFSVFKITNTAMACMFAVIVQKFQGKNFSLNYLYCARGMPGCVQTHPNISRTTRI